MPKNIRIIILLLCIQKVRVKEQSKPRSVPKSLMFVAKNLFCMAEMTYRKMTQPNEKHLSNYQFAVFDLATAFGINSLNSTIKSFYIHKLSQFIIMAFIASDGFEEWRQFST